MKYYLLPATEIFKLYRLENHTHQLQEYLRNREDVLENPVIFSDNVLCKKISKRDFSLFERVWKPEPGAIIVVGLYLELFEYWGESHKMIRMLQDASKTYPTHTIAAIWNHDNDFSRYNSLIPGNVKILNHGWTSNPGPNDIFLPFWKVVDNPYNLPKTQYCSFIGTPNNQARRVLVNAIQSYGHKDILFKQVFGDDYLRELNSTLFSLCPRGAGISSWRIFEAIQARSIPVILVKIDHFPMEDVLDWSTFSVMLPEYMISDPAAILEHLQTIDPVPLLNGLETAREQLSLLGTQHYVISRLS